ncbi:hypothetical protein ColTof4_14466 [Colletotrichum tofieldiae]|nr:hypothetical protein ColTof4_14466 [Colletotrichum tofieldiae]
MGRKSKITYTPWSKTEWAPGDTIAILDPQNDTEVGFHFRALHPEAYPQTWLPARQNGDARSKLAAERSNGVRANTVTSQMNRVGKVVCRVGGDGTSGSHIRSTAFSYDIFGHPDLQLDSLGRIAPKSQYDRLGQPTSVLNMDAGRQLTVFACDGVLILSYDSRSVCKRMVYDALRREIETHVRKAPDKPEYMQYRTVWGKDTPTPERCNLSGRVAGILDQSGLRKVVVCDFKGNALSKMTQLAEAYKGLIDCAGDVDLLPPVYEDKAAYDAIDRAWLTSDLLGTETRRVYDLLGRVSRLESGLPRDNANPEWIPHVQDIHHLHGRRPPYHHQTRQLLYHAIQL